MFSCWVVKTKSVAVEYVKKYESFEETSLMWGYGLQFIEGYAIIQLYEKNKNSKNKNYKS